MEKKPKKNTGFLSLFRKGKKKPEMVRPAAFPRIPLFLASLFDTEMSLCSFQEGALSAPVSPSLGKQVGAGTNGQVTNCSYGPADMPKKRRAPQPPVAASQSVPADLSTCHLRAPQVGGDVCGSCGCSDRSTNAPYVL